MTNKTELTLTIVNGQVRKLSAVNVDRWSTARSSDDENGYHSGGATKRRKMTSRVKLREYPCRDTGKLVTDTAGAVITSIAPIIVCQSAKTIYQHTGDAYTHQLMINAFNMIGTTSIYTAISDTVSVNANNEIYTETEHSYKMVEIDGKRKRVEIVPYVERIYTSYGHAVEKQREKKLREIANNDTEALIQDACLAFCELINVGLCSCKADLWEHSGYAYKMVNKSIHGKKHEIAKNDSLSIYDDEGNEIETHTLRYFDTKIARIERAQCLDVLRKTLKKNLDVRANADNVLTTFDKVFVQGLSQTECATILAVDEKTIRRYVSQIISGLQSPGVHDILIDMLR